MKREPTKPGDQISYTVEITRIVTRNEKVGILTKECSVVEVQRESVYRQLFDTLDIREVINSANRNGATKGDGHANHRNRPTPTADLDQFSQEPS